MSRPQYELSAAGRLDLLQTWNHLAENASLEVADQVLADIESAIEEVAKRPAKGHRRTDLTHRDILFFRVHSYLIVYRPDKAPQNVLRVLHTARDVKTLLAE
jgi:plasmid stabilization system protein ParE